MSAWQGYRRISDIGLYVAEKFAAFFPKGYTAEQMEQSILKLLEDRRRSPQRNRNDAR